MENKKTCQNCKKEFAIAPEDFSFYEKMSVPAPTFCPTCRFQRRFAFMNLRVFYKGTCDKCKKPIVSMYNPDSSVNVYCSKCWWDDSWDGTEYGKKYDPSRPFLTQLMELRNATPFMALMNNYSTLVNSEYVNYCATQKNCYMTVFGDLGENALYSDFFAELKDSSDCYRIGKTQLSYELVGGYKCYNVKWSEEIEECTNVFFSRDLTGCSDCFGCASLRNKKYCMWNEQLTKEEYQKRFSELPLNSRAFVDETIKKAREFWTKYPRRATKGDGKNINVIGEGVYESKNAEYCYMAMGVEDSKYVTLVNMPKVKDAYDYNCWGNNAERIYEVSGTGENSYNVMFSNECWPAVRNIQYSMFTMSGANNCFGCVNLKRKEYCILNKQYTKEEYEALVPKIIEDMKKNPYIDKNGRTYAYGEFFPYEMSLFAYNESIASDFYPLSKEEVVNQGFAWYEGNPNEYKITKQASELPDKAEEANEEIAKEIIACEKCSGAYRIIPQELDVLARMGVPLPRQCPKCRYADRFSRENLPEFFERKCDKCNKDIISSYNTKKGGIVYCEDCYKEAMV